MNRLCSSLPPANEVCEGYVFTRVCLSTRGSTGTPPDHVHLWDQVPPPGPDTPPGTRYTPWAGTPSPQGPGTPPPPGTIYPLGPGTSPQIPLWTRYTSLWDQVHSQTRYTPLREQCMPGVTGNKWVVHILLECIFVLMLQLLST